jgi:hypothetical protein
MKSYRRRRKPFLDPLGTQNSEGHFQGKYEEKQGR